MRKIVAIGLFLVAGGAQAQSLNLGTQFNEADLKTLTRFFGAATTFHQVNGPSELHEVWGVDVGVQLGATMASKFDSVVEANGGSNPLPVVPFGFPVIRGGFPFSIGAAFGMIPKISFKGQSFKSVAFSVRWSYGDFFEFPVSADVRFHFNRFTFNGAYTSGVQNLTAKMAFNTFGMTFSGGKKWAWNWFAVEPYLGVGWNLADASYTGEAGNSFISTGVKTSGYRELQSHIQTGVDFTLLKYVQLALEYNLVGTVSSFVFHFGATI